MLDEHVVFEYGDLDASVLGTDDHLAVYGLAACEELRLSDDGPAATRLATVAATLLLRLEPGRALDPLRLGDELDGALTRLLRFGRAGRLISRLTGASTVAPTGAGRGRLLGGGFLLGQRRERRDLGRRVEQQLGRDRGDEDFRQESEIDRRLGARLLVGGSLRCLVSCALGRLLGGSLRCLVSGALGRLLGLLLGLLDHLGGRLVGGRFLGGPVGGRVACLGPLRGRIVPGGNFRTRCYRGV